MDAINENGTYHIILRILHVFGILNFVGTETIAEQLNGCKNHQPPAIFFGVGGATGPTGPTGNWEAGFIDPLCVEVSRVVRFKRMAHFPHSMNRSISFLFIRFVFISYPFIHPSIHLSIYLSIYRSSHLAI